MTLSFSSRLWGSGKRPVWVVAGCLVPALVAVAVLLASRAPAVGRASTADLARSLERTNQGSTAAGCTLVNAGVYSCNLVFAPGSGPFPFVLRRSGNCWLILNPLAEMPARGCI